VTSRYAALLPGVTPTSFGANPPPLDRFPVLPVDWTDGEAVLESWKDHVPPPTGVLERVVSYLYCGPTGGWLRGGDCQLEYRFVLRVAEPVVHGADQTHGRVLVRTGVRPGLALHLVGADTGFLGPLDSGVP